MNGHGFPLPPCPHWQSNHQRYWFTGLGNTSFVSKTSGGPWGSYPIKYFNDAPMKHFQNCAWWDLHQGKGKVSWPHRFGRCWVKWNETGCSHLWNFVKTVLMSSVHLYCITKWFDDGNHIFNLKAYFWGKKVPNIQMANCWGSKGEIFVYHWGHRASSFPRIFRDLTLSKTGGLMIYIKFIHSNDTHKSIIYKI